MLMFILFILSCTVITPGTCQDLTDYNYQSYPSIDNSARPDWTLGAYYEEPQVLRKPCAHRRNNIQPNEEWVPSFRSMVSKPLTNDIFKAQSLKNENTDSQGDNTKVAPQNPTEEAFETVSSPSVEPPKKNESITPSEDSKDQASRRSHIEETSSNSDEQYGDYDCDIDLESEDYLDSQFGDGQYSASALGAVAPKTIIGIEYKVIEMLKECINKKQQYIEDNINQAIIPFTGYRRSMGDTGEESVDLKSGDQQSTANQNATQGVDKKAEDDFPGSEKPVSVSENRLAVFEAPAVTLRPGKLLNELKNPAKATGIADISRRMSENTRVCYACSTATNPSCWQPDNRTTIKYCHEDQNCVTKSFGVKNSLTILRDCAMSCDSSSVAGVEPKYQACSVCHEDLCNSAAINTYSIIVVSLVLTAIKSTF